MKISANFPLYPISFWRGLLATPANTDPGAASKLDNKLSIISSLSGYIQAVPKDSCTLTYPFTVNNGTLYWNSSNPLPVQRVESPSGVTAAAKQLYLLYISGGAWTYLPVPRDNAAIQGALTTINNSKVNINVSPSDSNEGTYEPIPTEVVGFGTNSRYTQIIGANVGSILNYTGGNVLYAKYQIKGTTASVYQGTEPKVLKYGLWAPNNTKLQETGIEYGPIDSTLFRTYPNMTLTTGGPIHYCHLYLQNKPVNPGEGFFVKYNFSLVKDPFCWFKYFSIRPDGLQNLKLQTDDTTGSATNSYVQDTDGKLFLPEGHWCLTIDDVRLNLLRRKLLNADPKVPVVQLNVRCELKMVQSDGDLSIAGSGEQKQWEAFMTANGGYYDTNIALTLSEIIDLLEHQQREVPDYTIHTPELDINGDYTEASLAPVDLTDQDNEANLKLYLNKIENPTVEDLNYPKLRTDFWKHGQGGIFNIKETIKPCKWYGKQHPFEFEVIVGNQNQTNKIFTNVFLHTNKVLPESVHYTFSGNQLLFSKDFRNMYFRQEATKAFYQMNGSDILYDHRAFNPEFYQGQIEPPTASKNLDRVGNSFLRPSCAEGEMYRATILPLTYSRQDTFNEIEDFYKTAVSRYHEHDYQNLTGGEVLYDWRTDSFAITNHIKVRDIAKAGRSRGNADFINGYYQINLNPFLIYQKQEYWTEVPPINLANAPVPRDMSPVNLRVYQKNDEGYSLEIADKTAEHSLNTSGYDRFLGWESTSNNDNKWAVSATHVGGESGEAIWPLYDPTYQAAGGFYDPEDNGVFWYSETFNEWTEDLENFVPKDVYKAGYRTTNCIDVEDWSQIYGGVSQVKPRDVTMKLKVRYDGTQLTLVQGVTITYNTVI